LGTQSQIGGDELKPASAGYVNWQTFLDGELDGERLEQAFLETLTRNVAEAGKWVEPLKRHLPRVDHLNRARIERLIGRYYQASAERNQAEIWTKRALKHFKSVDYAKGIVQCRLALFDLSMYAGAYDKARRLADEVLLIPSSTPRERLKIHVNLGNLEHRLHRYGEARQHFDSALSYLTRDPDPRLEAIVRHNMGCLEVCQNHFLSAQKDFERALDLFERQRAELYKAHTHQAYGNLYTLLGQFFHAGKHIRRARRIYQKGGDEVGAAYCDLDLFTLRQRLNQPMLAESDLEDLITNFEKLGLAYEKAQILFHSAKGAFIEGDDYFAEELLNQAQAIFKREGNMMYLARCWMLQGQIDQRAGNRSTAMAILGRAQRVFRDKKHAEAELETILLKVALNAQRLNDDDAKRVKGLLRSQLSHGVRIRALKIMADHAFRRRRLKSSVDHLIQAVVSIEEARASIGRREDRQRFFEDKTEIYELLIQRLKEWRHPKANEMMFRVIELSRTRSMSERMAHDEGDVPPVVNTNEPSFLKLHRLGARVAQLQRKLAQLQADPDAVTVEKNALAESFEETRERERALRQHLKDDSRLGLYYPVDLDLTEIKRILPEETLLVIYFMTPNQLLRLELDRCRLTVYGHEIGDSFRRDLNLMKRLVSRPGGFRHPDYDAIRQRMNALLCPRRLNKKRHVVWVPHKELQEFPFALMQWRGRPIGDSHCISQCPNLPTLYFSWKKDRPAFQAPVFFFSSAQGDPQGLERRTMKELFPRAKTFSSISEEGWSQAQFADFVHFAGHCHFNRKQPGRSRLSIGGESIYLEQFKDAMFKPSFINLASCQSGAFSFSDGNEHQGFVTSFFAVGAASVLASLWDIDDRETGEWMDVFYHHLDLGLAEAYRQACVQMSQRHADPYYWAGFSLMGRC